MKSKVEPVAIPRRSSGMRYPVTPPLSPINGEAACGSPYADAGISKSIYRSPSIHSIDDIDHEKLTHEDSFQSRYQASLANRPSVSTSPATQQWPSSPPISRTSTFSGQYTPTETPPPSPPSSKPRVHFSTRNPSVRRRSTPQSPVVHMSPIINPAMEVDAAWGVLFDENDEPTRRLTEVLQSLATHMINEYEPQQSLIISPGKIDRLFSKFHVSQESSSRQASVYRRDHEAIMDLFNIRSHTSADNLKIFYQNLHCEYYLTPSARRPIDEPNIPSLTPSGFVRLLILLIRSFPDEEAQRWKRIVDKVPLHVHNAAGSAKLPSIFPRRLFPCDRDEKSYSVLKNILHGLEKRTRHSSRDKARPRANEDRDRQRRHYEKPAVVVSQPWFLRPLAKLSGSSGSSPPSSPTRRREEYLTTKHGSASREDREPRKYQHRDRDREGDRERERDRDRVRESRDRDRSERSRYYY